jgi:hypothetical protein
MDKLQDKYKKEVEDVLNDPESKAALDALRNH